MSEEKKQQEEQQEQMQQEQEQEQQERQKKLQQAAKLLDEDGNLDISKYVDRIEAEKRRRIMAPIEEAMPWIVGTVVTALVVYIIIAVCSFSKGIFCNRAATRNLRQNGYVVDTDLIEARTVDFIQMIEDNGGECITVAPSKNEIEFMLGEYEVAIEGGTVEPRDEWDEYETDDLRLSELPTIYVRGEDDTWLCGVAEVDTQESETLKGGLTYASDAYFCTTRAGEVMIKHFFSVETDDIEEKIEKTEEYMKEYTSTTFPPE